MLFAGILARSEKPTRVCGKPGCIEVLASGSAIVKRARTCISEGRKSLINELAKGDLESITGQTVAQALAANDDLAGEILTDCADMLAFWLSNIVDILDPENHVSPHSQSIPAHTKFPLLLRSTAQIPASPAAQRCARN